MSLEPSPLNKQTTGTIDETDRISIGQADWGFRLLCTANTPTTPHGAITRVMLHARIYMSNNGPFSWDFSVNNPYAAPFITTGGASHYSIPDWIQLLGVNTYAGWDFADYGHNFNLSGQPVSKHMDWDITALASWSDAVIGALQFGVAMDEQQLSYNQIAGYMPIQGPGGNTPRYNISQLILEVDADDAPPPPIVYGASICSMVS